MLIDKYADHGRDVADDADPFPAQNGWRELTDLEPDRTPAPPSYTAWLPAQPEHTAPIGDDTAAEADVDDAATAARRRRRGRGIRRVGLIGTAAAAILAVGAALYVLSETAQHTIGSAPATAPVRPAPVSSSTVAPCPSRQTVQRIIGDGPGSTASGPDAVLALEWAYYVRRSAAAVRELLLAGGPFGPDAQIQSGIDAVPPGTSHCVDISPAGPGRWMVTITEHRPAGSTIELHQTITTSVLDGRTLITAVEPA